MKKRIQTILVLLGVSMLAAGCSESVGRPQEQAQTSGQSSEAKEENGDITETPGGSEVNFGGKSGAWASTNTRDTAVTPSVEPYTVAADLSNIDNLWQFYLTDGQIEKLVRNGFVVNGSSNEFFEIYEENRYMQYASFVTVDSLMHTYHLYFAHLQKNVEKDYLADDIEKMSRRLLDDSLDAYSVLKGSEWEEAARRNAAFFTVGLKLLDESTEVNSDVKDIVEFELSRINSADGITDSMITGAMEDYSQYVPRGYYEGDEQLERYFRAMMWYGRIHFTQQEEDLDRSALLISMMLSNDKEARELWEAVYEVTAFFAGASDDAGINEYVPLMQTVYGGNVTADTLLTVSDGFGRFHEMTEKLSAPRVNSVPIMDGEDNVIKGFRFMGQRFTIDADIMQNLIYSNVQANGSGDNRMLPDVLDVPAALGSDAALDILEEMGATDYAGYAENMEELKEWFAQDNEALWSASLYSGWLDTLRPLLEKKGEGYPMFMQNEEWTKKNLECFAGSFTELKHDTVLYTKQVIAEMGGGYEEEPDDRGYVEPEPEVYARFAQLSERTAYGLEQYGSLSEQDRENLNRLTQIADGLLEISKKELRDEVLTEDEYEFIRAYGGNLEHFWIESVKDQGYGEVLFTQEYPAALVVDIATDPNGQVLEAGTGNPSQIIVAVKVDGKVKLAKGSVYSFYQFAWPISDRLTDGRWHQMIGIRPNSSGNYEKDPTIRKPEWTESYRFKYEWE